MYFRDGDLLPENQEPLIITAAPYAPSWRPDDYPGEIPVTWDATGDDARRIMKIGVIYDTVEETLFNLGLPPNRPEGQPGFLVYDTDGRIPQVAGSPDVDPRQIL